MLRRWCRSGVEGCVKYRWVRWGGCRGQSGGARSQQVVTAYFSTKQLPPSGFSEQSALLHSTCWAHFLNIQLESMLPATRGSNHRDPQDDTVTSSGNHWDLQEHTATGFVADLVLADGALIQPIGNTRRIWISDSCTAWKNVKRLLSWTNPYDTGPVLGRRFIRILIVTPWSEKTLEAEAPLLQPPRADLYLLKLFLPQTAGDVSGWQYPFMFMMF